MRPTAQLISLLVVAAIFGMTARPAAAQAEPRTTLAGGYTFLREQGPGGFDPASYPVGWVATGSHRLGSGRLSAVGELGVSSRDNVVGERQHLLGLFGGARYAVMTTTRMTLFAQGLIGLERFSEPGFTESGLAIQPGAGVDWRMWSRYFLRAEADYRMSRQTGGTFNSLRALIGGGVRIGS